MPYVSVYACICVVVVIVDTVVVAVDAGRGRCAVVCLMKYRDRQYKSY